MAATNPGSRPSYLFLIGLLIGLLIGGGITALYLLRDPHKDTVDVAANQGDSSDVFAEKSEDMSISKVMPKTGNRNTGQEAEDQASEDDTDPELEVFKILDTLTEVEGDSNEYPGEDTLDDYREWGKLDDSIQNGPEELIPRDIRTVEGNPEVLRDELLFQTEIPVLEIITDSLGKMQTQEATESPLMVSFWRSPVNYKGYRKAGRNLVLFGIYAVDSVRFRKSGPHLYMDVLDKRYLITETFEFKHLVEMSRSREGYKP